MYNNRIRNKYHNKKEKQHNKRARGDHECEFIRTPFGYVKPCKSKQKTMKKQFGCNFEQQRIVCKCIKNNNDNINSINKNNNNDDDFISLLNIVDEIDVDYLNGYPSQIVH